ncbi:hypothetical protein [Bilophila wadsworthia]|jgi:hypothetical protein
MEKERDFSYLFDIIYDKFIESCRRSGTPSGTLALGKFLGHGHDGRVRAWKKGQWPSAEDCWTIEKKLGFNLRWLITGEGEPFDEAEPPHPSLPVPETQTVTDLRIQELERENAELNVELRGALKEIRQLNEEKRELEERLKCTPELQDNRLDNPQHATSDRPATGVPVGGM